MNDWEYLLDNDYETDFSVMNSGVQFPTTRMRKKNAEYRFRHKEFSGKYGKNRNLIVIVNKINKEIPYKVISLNYFKLMTNKMVDLIFNNELSIKTGDIDVDNTVNKLVERTQWINSIRQAVKYVTIYGDSCIKTYKNGASVFTPNRAIKIVDEDNVNDVKGYILYNPIIEKEFGRKVVNYIRFEVHLKGYVYEVVKRYTGGFYAGVIGEPVEYVYKGRLISKEGNWYNTGISDESMVQWLSINQEVDGVYGESMYQDIQDIVFALEHRVSMEHYALNSLADPLLIVGMSSVEEGEDGTYKLKTVNGNMLVTEDRNNDNAILPQQFQQTYELGSYMDFIDQLKSCMYELSEMGKVFLSSEYSGNISEESIDNLIKGAIDKANRIITDTYYSIRNSLYVLCRLNDIQVDKEDLLINFNIGQTDDDKSIAEICKILSEAKILSKATLRTKYFGYSAEQAIAEQEQIDSEEQQNIKNDDQGDMLVVKENEDQIQIKKEEETDEVE